LGQKTISFSTSRDKEFKDEIINGLILLVLSKEKLLFCDHHYSHALTAFLPSPFSEALVFCADGRGDGRSVTLWSATRKDGVKLIDEATELVSPGALYGFITKLLGFIPDRHEGKVTGLAAHGKKTFAYNLLKSGLYYDSGAQRIRAKYGECFRPFDSAELPKLKEALAELSREDFAWAVQAVLEEILLLFINKHISKSPKKSVNLCLAGG